MYRLLTTNPCESRPIAMTNTLPVVHVLDDDISIRESLELLIRNAGWRPELYHSASGFLSRPKAPVPHCLILDVNLPDLNGLELQEQLSASQSAMPIIFITGYGDVPMTVRAMKAGAVEFLMKPFSDDVLIDAIERALEQSEKFAALEARTEQLRLRYNLLSHREREVMSLVVAGMLNKQVGFELGISEITVKAHRGQVMRKMNARSLPDLVNMAARLGEDAARPAISG